ncbi:acyl-CoA dehydrogenase family protein [Blastococcus brunescens]|uniref:Acyl-CoA dehydrogenase family protein n=1 Tax=Blastococcus brunescens TaxID=1564165 RepID=A0ABZ1B083_9ACTN|nr:acyl-CoA dehydrogenase family protein [Blastococcus sp. BMG 8361]WRL64226.1 acyl-CoA dehydrogenase family protein [Blastococcus sp. BMG 8361]
MTGTDIPAELLALRDRVRAFVQEELWPLEPEAIRLELQASQRTEPFQAEPGRSYQFDPAGDLPAETYQRLLDSARDRGLWGIDVPTEFGGQGHGSLAKLLVTEEMSKTVVPFILPPESPNLHWLSSAVDDDQRARYLEPYARGRSPPASGSPSPGRVRTSRASAPAPSARTAGGCSTAGRSGSARPTGPTS